MAVTGETLTIRCSICRADYSFVCRQGRGRNRIYCGDCRRWSMRIQDGKKKNGYKITLTEYVALLQKQGYVCAICRNPETYRWPKQRSLICRLSVDHDHVTGRVRGLLCRRCNTGCGQFRDDPAHLRAAAAYLGLSPAA